MDDIAALAEANTKLVAAARGRGTSLSVEDRRHAQSLIRNVAVTNASMWDGGACACGFELGTMLFNAPAMGGCSAAVSRGGEGFLLAHGARLQAWHGGEDGQERQGVLLISYSGCMPCAYAYAG